MPLEASPGFSSDLYPTSGDESKQMDDEKRRDLSETEDTRMDMSVSDLSSSARSPSQGSGPVKLEKKRKRDLSPSGIRGRSPTSSPLADLELDGMKLEPNSKRQKPASLHAAKTSQRKHQSQILETHQSLDFRFHGLPISLWQKILGFVPPIFLGRVLRVNQLFHSLLDPNSKHLLPALNPQSIDAENIWKASRKRFTPGLPKNLVNKSELDMWKLLRGRGCQICGERLPLLTTSSLLDPWKPENEPEQYVRVVWPFGIRCCASCLAAKSEQEIDLMVSSTFPSFLLPALPFTFVTQSYHYVSSSTVRKANSPPDVQIGKVFSKVDIQDLKSRFSNAKDLGPGSAEEWIKGLEAEGLERNNRIHTWEQWESKGGLIKVNMRPGSRKLSSPLEKRKGTLELQKKTLTSDINGLGEQFPSMGSASGDISFHLPVSHPSKRELPKRPSVQIPMQKQERTLRDINEAKATRRSEIERRCATLKPPLTPDLLRHMESFQAALQISTPLTERAWEILKPRLIAQRLIAEDCEREWSEQVQAIATDTDGFNHQRTSNTHFELNDVNEREWGSPHTPLKDKLSRYADEVISNQWAAGHAITKENCPKFAVDVLLHVRKRFYDDFGHGCESDKPTMQTENKVSNHDKQDEKLILEHMKWVFDNKVKALTEHFQRELFMCNGCEGNSKFYGFEAVIQHYAAKHTTALSQGSVVVHWRAEWPDPPPFNPNPSLASSTFYAIPPPMAVPSPPQLSMAISPHQPYGDHSQFQGMLIPGLYSVPSGFQTGYYPQFQSTFQSAQPQPIPRHPSSLEYSIPRNRLVSSTSYHHTNSSSAVPTSNQQDAILGHPIQLQHGAAVTNSTFNYVSPAPAISQRGVHLYQTQKEEMAKQARDIWFGTSGIKDLPQSLRIFVVIQHVVTRFEQKYTNEPGLSMFIDGLDHSALMRPVRSLNGLACKTCVAVSNGNLSSQYTPMNSTPSDRKLYTLPHLLNHFRSAHLERGQSTINLQTGLEASRLDWKKDMIELPDNHLIADLVNAPGMTDEKLRLIASVLPNVFPDPLPLVGTVKSSGPIPKHGSDYGSSRSTKTKNCISHEKVSGRSQSRVSSINTASPPSWSYNDPIRRSRSPSLEKELAADDEYDPHRPAYLGRIIRHHQVSHSLARPSKALPDDDPISASESAGLEKLPRVKSQVHTGYPREAGPYSSQLLRHHDRANHQVAQQDHFFVDGAPERSEVSSRNTGHIDSNIMPEVIAADNFLRDLKPDLIEDTETKAPSVSQQVPRPNGLITTENPPLRIRKSEIDSNSNVEGRFLEQQPLAPKSHRYIEEECYHPKESHSLRRLQYVYADNGRPFGSFSNDNFKYIASSHDYNGVNYAYTDRPTTAHENIKHERLRLGDHPKMAKSTSPAHLHYNRAPRDVHCDDELRYTRISHPRTETIDTYVQPGYSSTDTGTGMKTRRIEYIPVSPENQRQFVIRHEAPPYERHSSYFYEEAYDPQPVFSRLMHPSYDVNSMMNDRGSEESSPHHSYRSQR